MSTIQLNEEETRQVVQEVAQHALQSLDLESLVRQVVREALQAAPERKMVFSASEAAKLLCISMPALARRRALGKIKATQEAGGRSYLYHRRDLEEALGRPLD